MQLLDSGIASLQDLVNGLGNPMSQQTPPSPLGQIMQKVNQPSPAGAIVSTDSQALGTGSENPPSVNTGTTPITSVPATPPPTAPTTSTVPSTSQTYSSPMNAQTPVANVVNTGLNAVGNTIHDVTSPLLQNPFIQQLLGTVAKASATAPIGQSLNQALQLIGGVTGNSLPSVYGGTTNGTGSNNGSSSTNGGLNTPYDSQLQQLTQKGQNLTNALQGMPTTNPQYAMYQKALSDTNTELDTLYKLQGDYRTSSGAIGQYASGSDGAKDIVSTGQENERMVELKQNLANDLSVSNPDPVKVVADIQAIRNDNVLLEGFKRMPGGDAAQDAFTNMDSSLDGLVDPVTNLINPSKLKGVLSAINNTSGILENNYDTQMRQAQVYDSTANNGQGAGDLTTAQRYNKYYNNPTQQGTNSATSILHNAINNTNFGEDSPIAKQAVNQAYQGGYMSGEAQAGQLKGKISGGVNSILPSSSGPQLPKGLSQGQYAQLKVQANNGDQASINYLKKMGLPN